MGKVSTAGSIRLFLGVATSNVIMAIGTVILARLMSPAEYGLYSVVLIPSLTIGLFRDWGVNSAMTRYVAYYGARKNEEDLTNIVIAGFVFEISTGLALSVLSLLLANFISSTVFHRPESAPLISILSITVFSGSLLVAAQSSFVGFERMELNSLTLILQAMVKTALSPLLVLLGFGVLGAVLGYTLSFLVAGIAGSAILYFFLLRNVKHSGISLSQISETLDTMLRYGVPLSISSILTGFLARFYGFMMAFYCSDAAIGNYHVAVNFAVISTFFTIPISTVLFPAFAKLDPLNRPQVLRVIYTSSVKYTALILVPVTAAMMVLSKPMISTLFGDQWTYAPFFLTLYIISNLFTGFGTLSMDRLLTGLGETKTLMKLSLVTLLVGLPLSIMLIPSLGVVGVILGTLFAVLPSMLLGLYWIWKRYEVAADWGSTIRIFIASTVAGATTFMSLSFINAADELKLIVGGAVFLAVYIVAVPLIGATVQEDINNLRALFSDLGFISKLLNVPLTLAEMITKMRTLIVVKFIKQKTAI